MIHILVCVCATLDKVSMAPDRLVEEWLSSLMDHPFALIPCTIVVSHSEHCLTDLLAAECFHWTKSTHQNFPQCSIRHDKFTVPSFCPYPCWLFGKLHVDRGYLGRAVARQFDPRYRQI